MFEYAIRKTKNKNPVWEFGRPSVVQQSKPHPYAVIDAEKVGHRPIQQQQHNAMLSPEEYIKARQYMDKRFYNEWLNRITEEFPRGSLVTYKVNPYNPDRKTAPFFFIVDFHQEIRSLAQWDPLMSEPRSVGMRPGERENTYTFVAPSQLRHLQEEEKKLVFLHHPKIADRILQAKGEEPSGDTSANDSYSG